MNASRQFGGVNDECPGSSEKERPVTNREVGGSSPPRGSTYHYVIVRRELSGGALLAQVLHASGESVAEWLRLEGPFPRDARGVVLVATKEQLAAVIDQFTEKKFAFARINETDGPLAGSTTAVGIVVADREFVNPILSHLKPWRAP